MELLGNKRGVLLQLNLAVLRDARPALQLWGLSATLGNLQKARDVLLPGQPEAPIRAYGRAHSACAACCQTRRTLPMGGASGPGTAATRAGRADAGTQQLLFTNTRAQAELWHQALAAVWPEELDTLALHHGSLDPALRQQVEDGLRAGALRCVVATSSLDLGVDFPEVEQVLQLAARRAWRACASAPDAHATARCQRRHPVRAQPCAGTGRVRCGAPCIG